MTGVVVVGGGLAGALAVQRCLERDLRPLQWFDATDQDLGRGSDVPCALVHPFVGRSFQPHPELAVAWRDSQRWLLSLSPGAAVHRAPLRRWIDGGTAGERLIQSYRRHREDLASLAEFAMDPGPRPAWIDYEPTYAFDLRGALVGMREQLAGEGVVCTPGNVVELRPSEMGGWSVVLRGLTVEARIVIVAAGRGTRALLSDWAPNVTLGEVEGTLVYGSAAPLPRFEVDRGHLSSTSQTLAWGSSFRRVGELAEDDTGHQLRAIEQRLRPRAAAWVPARAANLWVGRRVVDERTRHPWCGVLAQGLGVLSALGSKGGLWCPYLARRLVDALA